MSWIYRRSVARLPNPRFGLGRVVLGAATCGALAMYPEIAVGRDYSLHMLVHVGPQCALTHKTRDVALYSLSDGQYALRQGRGRVRVVCNTPFAVSVRKHAGSPLKRALEPASTEIPAAQVNGLHVSLSDPSLMRVAATNAKTHPATDADFSVISWHPRVAGQLKASTGRHRSWLTRHVGEVVAFEVMSKL